MPPARRRPRTSPGARGAACRRDRRRLFRARRHRRSSSLRIVPGARKACQHAHFERARVALTGHHASRRVFVGFTPHPRRSQRMTRFDPRSRRTALAALTALVATVTLALAAAPALAAGGGEASLVVPDLGTVTFGAVSGRALLMWGLVVCALGLVFGMVIYRQLKNLPVHASMREISELIYETCKTYLIAQGKFLLILEVFIGVIMVLYFGVLLKLDAVKVLIILLFSLIGIGGSYGVAWFGMRINTFANSRTAFASLEG